MRYLIILLLFCSCSSTLCINGVEVKKRDKVTLINDHTVYLLGAFVVGYCVTPMIIKK